MAPLLAQWQPTARPTAGERRADPFSGIGQPTRMSKATETLARSMSAFTSTVEVMAVDPYDRTRGRGAARHEHVVRIASPVVPSVRCSTSCGRVDSHRTIRRSRPTIAGNRVMSRRRTRRERLVRRPQQSPQTIPRSPDPPKVSRRRRRDAIPTWCAA